MRWINHQITTATVVYAATGNGTASLFAWVGSIMPDAIELPLQGVLKHRGVSHWPWSYFSVAVVMFSCGLYFRNYALFYSAFFFVGAVLHLLGDALSPRGIPWKSPTGERAGLGWYVPFQKSETIVAIGIVLAGMGVAALRGELTIPYIVEEIHRGVMLFNYIGRALTNA